MLNILSVDDDNGWLYLMRRYCKDECNHVNLKTFSKPERCLEYITRELKKGIKVDAVIVDRKMPKIPGEVLSVLIKEISKDIPVIMYTGDDTTFFKSYKAYKLDHIFQKDNILEDMPRILSKIKKT